MGKRMKEPHKKGVANHLDPESCGGAREGAAEALTGAHAGLLPSSEITTSGAPTRWTAGEGHTAGSVTREPPAGTAESTNQSMRGIPMRENRESPRSPPADGSGGSPRKGHGRDPGMHDRGQSDGLVVPTKSPNKSAPASGCGGDGGKEAGRGKHAPERHVPDPAPDQDVPSGLERVRKVAERDKKVRFTALLHHVTPDLLRAVFRSMNRKACPGVDGVTWQAYEQNLESNLQALHVRVQRGTYRAKPSRRAYIPKADGRQRPLGIASLEDKLVQGAVVRVLNAIYETDFLGFSYGFRPKRHQHNALDAVAVGITQRKVNWVLDADIRGFFDAIDHGWLLKFLEHRIADQRVLRLIQKWLNAGVLEDGSLTRVKRGSPQGASISPLLANIYLHHVYDLWGQWWRKTQARGDVILVRYADDTIAGFEHQVEAARFLHDLRQRLAKFGLELNDAKTRLIEFGRSAASNRRRRGLGKPETFDFLGLTHICGTTRKGDRFQLRRHTMKKRLRAKLKAVSAALMQRRHEPVPVIGAWLGRVVRGYFNYHAVPTNIGALRRFRDGVIRTWRHALQRRSQQANVPWPRMGRLAQRWLPRARITHPWPSARLVVGPTARAV